MSYIGINPQENIYPFIEKKPDSAYPKSVLNEIHLISFNKNGLATPFGSYTYRIQKYPGDVDLLESFYGLDDIESTIVQFEKSLKRVVKNIISKRTHYFSEFKAGIDKRFDINIGEIQNGTYFINLNLLKISKDFLKKKLITNEEFLIIKHIFNKLNDPVKVLNGNDYDIINYIFREHRILRWTANEILAGKKKLPGNETISLKKALSMLSPVKIDEISLINGRFIEVTNFIMLAYFDEGKLIPINLPWNLEDKAQLNKLAQKQLPDEIEKLYYSNMNYSPFKMIKRMYALARQIQDKDMLFKILPFISSNTSLAYQIKSEIDTIINLYEKLKSPPAKTIENELDEIKGRISTIIELGEDDELVNTYIDMINKTKSKQQKIELLKELKKFLMEFINYESINYLNQVGLNPPSYNYLPSAHKYDDIVRTPEDNPVNPLKRIRKELNLD